MTSAAVLILAVAVVLAAATHGDVVVPVDASPRVKYGAERLRLAQTPARVVVRVVRNLDQGPEGFRIDSADDGSVTIRGADDSGALYGCLDLARRIREAGRVPADLHFAE